VVSAAVLVGAVIFGLADWTSSSSSGYVVQPGDSLWRIATAHGLTVAQLAGANRLDPADILPIGLHLYVPSNSAQLDSAPVPSTKATPFTFCATFSPDPGPYGVLPAALAGSSRYYGLAPIFRRWASHYGLSLPLLEAVAWQESGWQQGVVSPTGAVGVGQIEPYTAKFIADDLVGEPLNIHSVSDNIRMSAAFLAHLADIEGNNQCATIAAYYEGPLNLQSVGVMPSTRQYVADVEALLPRFE
jgi:soluble lytic murein transglycosylase-like protein